MAEEDPNAEEEEEGTKKKKGKGNKGDVVNKVKNSLFFGGV